MELHFSWENSFQEIPLIVYVMIAALFTLIGVTAVSSMDFTKHKRN